MITIVLVVIFGALFSLFATQNTTPINIFIGSSEIAGIPTYFVVLASIGLGVFIVSLYHILHSLSLSMTLGDREKEIKSTKKEVAELLREVHKLEIENTKLKAKLEEEDEKFDENGF